VTDQAIANFEHELAATWTPPAFHTAPCRLRAAQLNGARA
jgi:hypothetical protein